jgi:hypothetical protein
MIQGHWRRAIIGWFGTPLLDGSGLGNLRSTSLPQLHPACRKHLKDRKTLQLSIMELNANACLVKMQHENYEVKSMSGKR